MVRAGFWVRALAGLLLFGTTACSDGPLTIRERYYLIAANGDNTNYYRVTVTASTRLSKAEFRQGWYPADAVDTLFSEVSSEAGAAALQTEDALRAGINETLLALDKKYREALLKLPDNKVREEIDGILEARRLLYIVPAQGHKRLEGTEVIEYDPAKNVITRRSGSKLLFILSADPDSIIQDIAEIAEQQKTQVAIQQFSAIINNVATRGAQRASAQRSFQTAVDGRLSGEIAAAAEAIDTLDPTNGGLAVAGAKSRLESLDLLIRQQGGPRP